MVTDRCGNERACAGCERVQACDTGAMHGPAYAHLPRVDAEASAPVSTPETQPSRDSAAAKGASCGEGKRRQISEDGAQVRRRNVHEARPLICSLRLSYDLSAVVSERAVCHQRHHRLQSV